MLGGLGFCWAIKVCWEEPTSEGPLALCTAFVGESNPPGALVAQQPCLMTELPICSANYNQELLAAKR